MITLRWILLNGAMMGSFLFGVLWPNEGFLNIGLVLVYITIIMGVFSLFISVTVRSKFFDDAVRKNPNILEGLTDHRADKTFDVVMSGVLAFFGYPILAVWYVIHIFGLHTLLSRIKESKKRIEEE